MKEVVVITGGGSGMGLAAAKYMSKEKIIVLSGRTVSKLEKAVGELTELGYQERLGVLAAPRKVRSTFLIARLRSAGGFNL